MSVAAAVGAIGGGRHALTVEDVVSDPITALANLHWAPSATGAAPRPFSADVVKTIYTKEINNGGSIDASRLVVLELTGFLENYLLPHFNPDTASFEHVMCIILMVLEKTSERVPVWKPFGAHSDKVTGLFRRIVRLPRTRKLSISETTLLTQFLIAAFAGLEVDAVRQSVLRLASLPVWKSVAPGRVELELLKYPSLRRHWDRLSSVEPAAPSGGEKAPSKKRAAPGTTEDAEQREIEETFLPSLIREFITTLTRFGEDAATVPSVDKPTLNYLERFVELLTDLMSQLPTRRFVRLVLLDQHVVIRCKISSLYGSSSPKFRLYRQLVDALDHYVNFAVDDQSGLALSRKDVEAQCYSRVQLLQRLAYKYYPESLSDFALSSVGAVGTPDRLRAHVSAMTTEQLTDLCTRLQLLGKPSTAPAGSEAAPSSQPSRHLLEEILITTHAFQKNKLDDINALPLYPTESLLWDDTVLPLSEFHSGSVLALPKLNLQFLTFQDYLLRSFTLFRLESAYEVREDIADAVERLSPRKVFDYDTGARVERIEFQGWSRMAMSISHFRIDFVSKPQLGSDVPVEVRAELEINLNRLAPHIRSEWDSLREHDIIFLMSVTEAKKQGGDGPDVAGSTRKDVARQLRVRDSVVSIRGAEVVQVLDEAGKLMNDFSDGDSRGKSPAGTKRVIRVQLDPAQYFKDATSNNLAVYEGFNIVLRRRAKENNFKAVLETIRDVMNVATVGKAIPPWLHDVFLGYGDAAAAHYRNLPPPYSQLREIDFIDTFINGAHALSCFPGKDVSLVDESGAAIADPAGVLPPFRVQFQPTAVKDVDRIVIVKSKPVPAGPYPEDLPRLNPVPFTPVQVEAIRSGCNPGLTLIVGPPGTGKTDVAVQIISNIYHNFPGQRTLLVTHSNHALNDLFEKIMQRDIQERDLVRLGSGERDLDTDSDFSKWGRVTASLELRMNVLAEVDRLGTSLRVTGDFGYTCETAINFFRYHITPRVDDFRKKCSVPGDKPASFVIDNFPFLPFFSTAPGGVEAIFKQVSFAEDLAAAEGCLRHLDNMLAEVTSYRPFELFRSQRQRTNFLLAKQARIVAMTCTHAALTRRQLVQLGFKYDNIVMEEAAQILEVETFIPMLLQNHDAVDGSRLKRVILIGDHHQLPPVVKNIAFQTYGNLDQSLFTRFVRLGIPTIELNQQGRARPPIAALYSWRYAALGNMGFLSTATGYNRANAGFRFDYQLIDVPDYNGAGESQPQPHFFQNLAEAEYVVATFQYMRLLGYPAQSITILTTYNGQKMLIDDVITSRCAGVPMYGRPKAVSTVDRYQGQQNDFVLLSLVRTKHVGHLRDVRRLVVAMSRARLGLYVFCRQSLFASCYELAPTFSQLLSRPSQLALVTGEVFPAIRSSAADVVPFMVEGLSQLGMIVQQMAITALQRQPELAKATVPTPVVSKSDDGDEDVAMDRPSVLEDAPTPPPADDAPTPPPAQPSDDGDEDAPMGAAEPVILPPTAARVEPQAVSVEVDNTLAPSEPAAAVSIPTVTPVVTVPVVAPSVAAPAAVPEPDVTPAVSVPVPEPAPSASVPLPVFTPAVSVPVPEVTQATVTPSTSSDGAAAASSSSPAITLALEFDSHAGVVVVGNHSSEPINLGNYVIKASASQYVFDSGVVIAPEGRVTVWTGKGAKKRESEPDQYVWSLSPVLDGEEVVTLCDPSGGTVCTANGRPYRIAARANAARGTITLINEATRQQPFKKWSLVGPSDIKFAFPDSFILKSGATVTVWTGEWTTDVVFGSDGDVVTLIDKDGETATLAVARVSNTVQLSLSAAGVVTIVNSAPTTLDISGYTLEAVTSGEVFTLPEETAAETDIPLTIHSVKPRGKAAKGAIVWSKSTPVSASNSTVVLKDVGGTVVAKASL